MSEIDTTQTDAVTADRDDSYEAFIMAKVAEAPAVGFEPPLPLHESLFPHQRDIVRWACLRGRAAIFASFGLGKTRMQLEVARQVAAHANGPFLIVAPLAMRREFRREGEAMGMAPVFVRTDAEVDAALAEGVTIFLTNYESVREQKINPARFAGVSLDEAAILRGFGGTKTFREAMATMAGDDRRDMSARVVTDGVRYRFVATATPSPNEFIELLAYSAFLGVMDVSTAKTRFFERDSEKADNLTLHPQHEAEFWRWIASWAVFVTRPSDIDPAYSDDGYDMPELDVQWHEIPTHHLERAGEEKAKPGKSAQLRMFADAAKGVSEASKEARASLDDRIAKLAEIRAAAPPGEHRVIWHDLEDERRAIEAAFPDVATVYGSQDLEEREGVIERFSDGEVAELAAKPVMLGSGCNFQKHCATAIFLSVGYKFNEWIQAIHRIARFGQPRRVTVHVIYTEAQREIRRALEAKWSTHREIVDQMTSIVRERGLGQIHHGEPSETKTTYTRVEASGALWRMINTDTVDETRAMQDDSVDLIATSIPFSSQYKYSDSYRDFGHSDTNEHFFQQMGFLSRNLHRVLKPGRVFACHVKDRVVPGGMNGMGFQTIYPFHADCINHYVSQGFAYMGMITVVTDVVRENAQTYRLGWTEVCRDSTKIGVGLPEYILLFRKPPTSRESAQADDPVAHDKAHYTRGRWQIDAHAFWRSSGNRLLTAADFIGAEVDAAAIFQRFAAWSSLEVYDYENHVALCEALDTAGKLPPSFMLLQPQSHSPEAWTDVARMRTLNTLQAAQDRVKHLCLARGSLVLTRGGYVPIEDIEVGTEVLTHKGRWRRVLVKGNTGVRPVVTVKAQGVPGLTLTPDHKLWTREVRDIPWAKNHAKLEASRVEPGWVEAQHTVGSYVNLKLPPVESPSTTDLLHWWTVGRWLADGHINLRGGAMISCGRHEVDQMVANLGHYAGNPPSDTGTCWQILLRDPDRTLRATLDRCGKYAHGKHLPPEAFTLPVEQSRALLQGYLSGDGHLVADRGRWQVTCVSKELLFGVAMLAQRVYGAVATIHAGRVPRTTTIEGRTVETMQEWVLSFEEKPGARKPQFVLDDGAWKRVRSCEPAGEVETWNIRVEEDESYIAEGCVVKNCPMQFDIADRLIERFTNPGEVVFDPFGGLGTVPLRAMRLKRRGLGTELNPVYWREAVRYLRAEERAMATPTLFDLDTVARVVEAPQPVSPAQSAADRPGPVRAMPSGPTVANAESADAPSAGEEKPAKAPRKPRAPKAAKHPKGTTAVFIPGETDASNAMGARKAGGL